MIESGVMGPNKRLPFFVEPHEEVERGFDSLMKFFAAEPAWVDSRLCCHGALLFRGFALSKPTHFRASRIPSRVRERFAAKGVAYIQNLRSRSVPGPGKSWQETFETDKTSVAEKRKRPYRASF